MAVRLGAEDRRRLPAVQESPEDAPVDVDDAAGGRAVVVVGVVAVPGERGVGVGGHEGGRDGPAHLRVVQAAEEPRAPRVGHLHLETAVQLAGMPDDLVRDQGVVVRIGDDHDVAVGRGERGGGRELDRLPGEIEGERPEVGQLHERLVHAVGEDLPAALVADHVVELLARLRRRSHHVGHALGQREGLVDEGSLGGAEQLARELREGGEVAVGQARIEGADLPAELGRRPDHGLERHRARVDAVDGGDDLPRHADRGQARVGEARPQPGKLLACRRLGLAARRGPAVRPAERLAQDLAELRQVGRAQGAAEVPRPDHAAAGQHPNPVGARVVVVGELRLAVLDARDLALGDLEADVGVDEVGEGAGPARAQLGRPSPSRRRSGRS